MSFGPATPMSFARILRATAPGFTYDKVTYPNLPAFAETLTFDRYNDDQTPTIYPILRVPNFDPRRRVGIVDLAGLGSVDAVMGWAAQHKTLLLILGIGLVWGVATRGPKSNRRRRRNSGMQEPRQWQMVNGERVALVRGVSPDIVVVQVDKGFRCDGGKALPYSTSIGTINKKTGRINVWMPAAYTPRGYKAAAKRMLEDLVSSVKGT